MQIPALNRIHAHTHTQLQEFARAQPVWFILSHRLSFIVCRTFFVSPRDMLTYTYIQYYNVRILHDSIVAIDLQSQDPTVESPGSPKSPKLSRYLRSQRSHRSQRSLSRFRSSSPRRRRSRSGSSPNRQTEAWHDMAPGHGIHFKMT